MQYVYVLNKHGEPLMPCSPRKARLLLNQKKACVVKRTPFTIKLLYGSTGSADQFQNLCQRITYQTNCAGSVPTRQKVPVP